MEVNWNLTVVFICIFIMAKCWVLLFLFICYPYIFFQLYTSIIGKVVMYFKYLTLGFDICMHCERAFPPSSNTLVTSHIYSFLRTLTFCSFSKFQLYNTILSTVVTISSGPLYLKPEYLCAFSNLYFSHPQLLVTICYSLFLWLTFF